MMCEGGKEEGQEEDRHVYNPHLYTHICKYTTTISPHVSCLTKTHRQEVGGEDEEEEEVDGGLRLEDGPPEGTELVVDHGLVFFFVVRCVCVCIFGWGGGKEKTKRKSQPCTDAHTERDTHKSLLICGYTTYSSGPTWMGSIPKTKEGTLKVTSGESTPSGSASHTPVRGGWLGVVR